MNTLQQEFDAVVLHLYTQKRPATVIKHSGPGCYYRVAATADVPALSCAVGCRIPDAVYQPLMDNPGDGESISVHDLVENFGSILPPEIPAYIDMFSRLQQVHDNTWNTENGVFVLDRLEVMLRQIATEFQLNFNVPQGV